ncbi:hypothetical protein RB653_000850 [Dictyostelium firmibasis]|uniref:FNIP repeat-containing protein n=1 Tax=Dictyostelium firmibasis TaxID=79012 RepID=A0AAN7U401_9MYCE
MQNYSILLNLIYSENEATKLNKEEEKERSTFLFFKIWRNLYLKSYILGIIKNYFINRDWRTFTLESLNKNKNKDYFKKVILRNPIQVMDKGKYYQKKPNNDSEDDNLEKQIQLPKNSITHLSFTTRNGKDSVFVIYPGFIPHSVTSLEMDHFYNSPLSKGLIPNSVTNLTFGSEFNQSIEVDDLPLSIQILKFGNNFNKPLKKGSIPYGVKSITFGIDFNQVIDEGVIPSSCVQLIFGQRFKKRFDIGSIPNGVKILKLPLHYREYIGSNVLPSSILDVNVGSSFYTSNITKIGNNIIPNSCIELRYRGTSSFSIDTSTIPNVKVTKYNF